MTLLSYCPECQIGLNNAESRLGKCQNCGATWDPYDPDLVDEWADPGPDTDALGNNFSDPDEGL